MLIDSVFRTIYYLQAFLKENKNVVKDNKMINFINQELSQILLVMSPMSPMQSNIWLWLYNHKKYLLILLACAFF